MREPAADNPIDRANGEAIARKLDAILEAVSTPPRRWLSVRSAAAYSDLSEESLRRLIDAGKLTGYRPLRGKLLIDRYELDALIARSTAAARGSRGAAAATRPRGPRGRFREAG